MIHKSIAILFTCLAVSLTASAQQPVGELEKALQQKPNDVQTLVALGKIYLDQAAAGDAAAVEKGMTYLDKALEIQSTNSVALAYRGSLWTIRGREASDPFDKMNFVEKGIDEMDRAVEMTPDNVTARLVRGVNSVKLPSLFNRLAIAIKDFSFLLADSRFSHLDVQLQSTIYYWAGVAYKNDNQKSKARELLEKAISTSPNSGIAASAQEELNSLL